MQRVRPLPGILFRAEAPVSAALPRMDIAGFVGFTMRGPLDTPVVVEDYPHLEDIFGGSYPLAWDAETATQQTACLAPAVKTFFAQGGRRCQVVRVAGKRAAANQFPIAGLLRTGAGGYQPVVASARSQGSWSDGLQANAGLLLDALAFAADAVRPGAVFTLSIAGQPFLPGDLLQLDCSDGFHRAYAAPEAQDLVADGDMLRVTARPERTCWFRRVRGGMSGTVRTLLPAPAAAAGTLKAETAGTMALSAALAAAAGDWLLLEAGAERAWLLVADARGSEFGIAAAWLEGHGPTAPVITVARAGRAQISLQARHEATYHQTLNNLACAAPHPRFIGDLPDDAALFAPRAAPAQTEPSALWGLVSYPRFPLALGFDQSSVVIPLGLEAAPGWRGALPVDQEPLVRDGLVPDVSDYYALTDADWAAFMVELHVDAALRFTGQRALLGEASDLLYLQGRSLRGLHALLPVDEISMVALTDVTQRGWLLTQRHTQAEPPPPPPPAPDDPCAVESPFEARPPASEPSPAAGKTYESLKEIPQRVLWQLLPSAAYDASGLLEVQTAAASMAAARGDMLAVLGMPKHYRAADALLFQRQFAAALRVSGETTDSYAALYYPWVVTREDSGALLHTHPAGAACGTMAARSLSRGAWVAPANEVVRGALAVVPAPRVSEEASLYSAGINLIRQMPPGHTLWGAYTQSLDFELENINVRRLLILLRRLALREGQSYVFAPHSPAFRGRVRQQFERALSRLFAQGAFAGGGPAEAYRVVIDETLNTQASVEQGRLIVELRVAPSQPLTFITVRLVQAESGLLAVQEVTANGG